MKTIKTIDFGVIPIRKNFIEGKELTIIDLSSQDDNIAFASIRTDIITQQPFAVLLNDELEVV